MSKVLKIEKTNDIHYVFECPACGDAHIIDKRWSFNGDFEKPTFSPSVLVEGPEWNEEKQISEKQRCHSFVRNGKIQYLSDCTHELAGKTIDMLNLVESEWKDN